MNARKMLAGFACLWIAVSSANAAVTVDSDSYTYSTKIPINYAEGDQLDNFPVLVVLTAANFDYSKVRTTTGVPQDLRFTVSDVSGTALPYEIDGGWNDTGTTRIWVKVPTIPANPDPKPQIYAVYGNAIVSAPSYGASVWDNSFYLVYHFNEGTGPTVKNAKTDVPNVVSSVDWPYNAAWVGTAAWVDALIGKGVSFNANVANYLDTKAYPVDLANNGNASKTIEMWVKFNGPCDVNSNRGIFSMGNAWNQTGSYEWSAKRYWSGGNPANGFRAQVWGNERDATDADPTANANWTHFAMTWIGAGGGNKPQIYRNGVLNTYADGGTALALKTDPPLYSGHKQYGKLFLGSRRCEYWPDSSDTAGNKFGFNWTAMDGSMDEVRVSGNTGRSAGWFKATYLTAAQNDTFSPTTPMISGQSDDGTGAPQNLYATLNWPATADTTVYVHWGDDTPAPGGSWDSTVTLPNQTAGALSTQISPTLSNTRYYYQFSAVNGSYEGWATEVKSFMTGDLGAGPATVSVAATDLSADEAGANVGVFTVTRTGSTAIDLVVKYTLTGTATEGSDYQTIATKQVTIPSGSESAPITITPIDDILFETPETVICTLTTGSGYELGSPTVSDPPVTLTSDDVSALSGFRHSMPITVSGYTGLSTLNNFPVLVKLSESIPGFHYSDFASSSGGDLRFVDSAQTTRLNYEIEKWDITGISYVWVQVPALSGATTKIYAFWGNPDGTTAPTYSTDGSAWAGIYDGVFHLDGLTGAGLGDSSANHNNLTASGTMYERAGAVSGGIRLNSSDDYLTASGAPFDYAAGTPTAVEMWVWADTSTTLRKSPIGIRSASTRWSLHYAMDFELDSMVHSGRFGVYNGGGSDIVAPDITGKSKFRWYHLLVLDPGEGTAGRPTYYIDGVYAGQTAANGGFDATKTGNPLYIGTCTANHATENWMGRVDEVRISHHAHSTDWILANYKTQSSSTFLTFGTVENLLTDTGATGLAVGGNVTLNGTITGVPAWPVHAYLCWGSGDGGAAYPGTWDGGRVDLGSQAGPGPVTLTTSLSAGSGTTYYRFYVDSDLTQTWTPLETYAPATVSISATDGSATEDGVNGGTFEVTRSGVTDGPLTVRYTLGGTAANGADYTALSSNVTFAVGETTKTISVTPLADTMANEGSETVVATLVNGGYELGTAVASVTIADSGSDVTSGWTKSVTFTLSGYAGATELQNFPVLVRLSTAVAGFKYADFSSGSGGDLRFTDENGTQWLPHEIDTWNVAGESTVWVKLPRLSGTTTKIKAWWHNPSETTPPDYTTDGTVWTNGFAGVWHYREASSSDPVDDSTANNFSMTPHSSPTIEAGPVGNGRGFSHNSYKYFDGAGASENSFGATADGLGIGTYGAPFTFETMVNVNTSGGWIDGGLMWLGMHGNMNLKGVGIRTGTGTPNGQLCVNWKYNVFMNATGIAGDSWLHVAAVYDGGTVGNNLRLYVNGAQVQAGNINSLWEIYNTFPMQLGGWWYDKNTQNTLTGNLDESRVSASSRSADWIKASADTIQNAAFATYPLALMETINQAVGQSDPSSAGTINFTVVFNQAVSDFLTGDVTLGGTAGATTAIVTGGGTTYNVAVSGMTGSGTVIASIDADKVHTDDGYATPNDASTSTDNNVTFAVPLTVTLEQAVGQGDPSSAATINFTVVFSAAVADFLTGDVTLGGTAGATTAVVTGGGTTYNVAVSGMTGSGTVIASILAGKAHDGYGTANGASTSTDNSVAFVVPPLTVTLEQAVGQSDPSSAATINFTVVFSAAVADFLTGDVTLGGTAGATTAVVTGGGTTYNVAVSGMTSSGTVIASILAGKAHDGYGTANGSSTSTDNVVARTIPDTTQIMFK